MPVNAITIDHALAAISGIPTNVGDSMRRTVGHLIQRLLRLAQFPLRLIAAQPLPPAFLPKKPKGRLKTYPFPAEDAKILACTSIPLVHRIFIGTLVREGLRCGELIDAEVGQVDLDNGMFHLPTNKTDDPRSCALDPSVREAYRIYLKYFHPNPVAAAPLLFESDESSSPAVADYIRAELRRSGRSLRSLAEQLNVSHVAVSKILHGGGVAIKVRNAYAMAFHGGSDEDLRSAALQQCGKRYSGLGRLNPSHVRGTYLRRGIEQAGISRPQLWRDDKFHRHITVHDLRATFVTVALASGKTEAWITDRTGHKSSEMVYRYKRQARTHAEVNLGAPEPQWQAIPELKETARREQESCAELPDGERT